MGNPLVLDARGSHVAATNCRISSGYRFSAHDDTMLPSSVSGGCDQSFHRGDLSKLPDIGDL